MICSGAWIINKSSAKTDLSLLPWQTAPSLQVKSLWQFNFKNVHVILDNNMIYRGQIKLFNLILKFLNNTPLLDLGKLVFDGLLLEGVLLSSSYNFKVSSGSGSCKSYSLRDLIQYPRTPLVTSWTYHYVQLQ